MLPRIMHHCAFLIITFLTYTLCIRNGDAGLDAKRNSDNNYSPEARQSNAFHQSVDFDSSGFIPSTGSGFRFPDNHQANANNPNEQPSHEYTNPYPNNHHPANTNQRANPHNLAFNTGEQRPTAANNHNHYPYQQQHPNAIATSVVIGNREPSGWPNANGLLHLPAGQHYNKNPNYPPQGYQQRPTYAQAYDNYLFNRQPNYNRRPTPPPPPVTDLSHGPYQEGQHLTRPYQNDLTSSLLTGLQAGTYPPQYANQFGNSILPFGIGGSGGTGGGGGGGILGTGANPLSGLLNSFGGGAFAAGNPLSMQIIRGLENIARNDDLQCVPKVLCQMLGSPSRRAQLPAFITSPMVTSFVSSLPSTSPALIFGRAALLGISGGEYKCARTYPRCPQSEDDILYYLNNHRGGFFKFFSEPEPVLDADNLYSTPSTTTTTQQQSQPSIFNFLTGLGGSTNTNQATNLNSFMSDTVTSGIGSLFGYIISGFVSGQAAAARRQDDDVEENSDLIESNSTATEPEGRILNNKSNILAYAEPFRNPISFPPPPVDSGNDNHEAQQFDTEFRFPSTSHRDVDDDNDYRRGKGVSLVKGSKMIFPDRTGTGNLRFDNDEYFRVGKIINRQENYATTSTTRRTPSYNDYTREYVRPSGLYSAGGLNRYASSDYNRGSKDDLSGNVYVTNGQGITEYYINSQGRKVYL